MFGGGTALRPSTPDGRIKVTDQIVWINCVPPDGVPRRMAAFAGESLLEVLERHSTPGIWADCEGGDKENSMRPYQVPVDFYSAGVHCAQCAVHIPNPWFDKLNRKPDTEVRRLTTREEGNSSFVRLACCVKVRPDMNEMVCVVGNNRSTDGEWFGGDNPQAF
mmetsp:Transcript_40887/g.53570  ORF Transcript_40887/g.53570 Transcript_40887/m.53570 type:complete len:163 (+) Transcript_40887:99-587(+)